MTLNTFGVKTPGIAYLSMEFGIEPAMPTYSGGLGILAGDTVRAAADLGLPMIGITLLHRKGYIQQHLDADGVQSASDCEWSPREFLELLPQRAIVTVEGRPVHVQAWRHLVRGESGHTVPVYFLDTCIPENTAWDQSLSHHLYIGDARYRLCQEAVLGLGGVAMLRALGYQGVQTYHMNEGHSALVTLALLEAQTWGVGLQAVGQTEVDSVRNRCVFTTHTPIAAGHDRFSIDLVRQVLGDERTGFLSGIGCCPDGSLNMTHLALNFSGYVNGVSMCHEGVCRSLFSNRDISAITNGVHAATWTSPPFQRLFGHYIPQWRRDNLYLRYAVGIPLEEIRQAHADAKQQLLAEVQRRTGVELSPDVMTLGFGRRATAYKRTDFLFRDLDWLKRIATQVGPLQIICAGKADPRDEGGQALIQRIFRARAALKDVVPVVYLEDYDMTLGKYLCSGVDLWVNTPQKPQEASGTSGMKAALNGVPSFSILDGWWIEGHIEGVTGWSIGDGWQEETNQESEITSMYNKLENVIVPMYYRRPSAYANIRRSAIAMNGAYFNAQRMVVQYLHNAYLRNDDGKHLAQEPVY